MVGRVKLLALFATLATSIALIPTPGLASHPKADCGGDVKGSALSRTQLIRDELVRALQQNASRETIDQTMKAKYCLENRTQYPDTQSGITPFDSTAGAVSVDPPTFYFDPEVNEYHVWSFWRWLGLSNVFQDTTCVPFNLACRVGGYEGFGLALSRRVESVSNYEAQTWSVNGAWPPAFNRMFPSDANTYGATFAGQDEVVNLHHEDGQPYSDYSFYNGMMIYDVSNMGCGITQAFAKYAHTWDETSITGIGVGPYSLSVQWVNAGHNWETVSKPSSVVVTTC